VEVELVNKKIAHAVDRFLDRLWPPTIQSYVDHAAALAAAEETTEVWEPPKRNPEFDDLPTVQVLSARMSDDDVEFISDLRYLHDLTNEIFYHTTVFGPQGLTDMPELPNTFEDRP
jgi:hypothetical protein